MYTEKYEEIVNKLAEQILQQAIDEGICREIKRGIGNSMSFFGKNPELETWEKL